MWENLIVQAIGVVIQGLCVGTLLSFFIPADPASLPRTVSWLQANKDPKPGSSIPLRPYRWGISLMSVGIVAYSQYLNLRYLVLFPTWASAYGSERFLWFAFGEVTLPTWTAYVFWTFRRAAARSR